MYNQNTGQVFADTFVRCIALPKCEMLLKKKTFYEV